MISEPLLKSISNITLQEKKSNSHCFQSNLFKILQSLLMEGVRNDLSNKTQQPDKRYVMQCANVYPTFSYGTTLNGSAIK
jgi:hypothetical protein